MKRRYFKRLYHRAVSLAVAFSMTMSLCLAASVMPTAGAEETGEEEVFGDPHIHTFACYEHFELDCIENHPEDGHREQCYTYSGELVCGMKEGQLHDHDVSGCEAVARVLVCGKGTDGALLGDGTDLIAGEDEEETEEELEEEDGRPGGDVSGSGSGDRESGGSAGAPELPGGDGAGSGEDSNASGDGGDSGPEEGSAGSGENGGGLAPGGSEGGDNTGAGGDGNEGSAGEDGNEEDASGGIEEDPGSAGADGEGSEGSAGADGEENEGSADADGEGNEGSAGEDGSGSGAGAGTDEGASSGGTDGNGAGEEESGAGTDGNSTGNDHGNSGLDSGETGGNAGSGEAPDGGTASSGQAGGGNADNAAGRENYALFTANRLMQGRVFVRRIDAGGLLLANNTALDPVTEGTEDAEAGAAEPAAGEECLPEEDGAEEPATDGTELLLDRDIANEEEEGEALPEEGMTETTLAEDSSNDMDGLTAEVASPSNADAAEEEEHVHKEGCYAAVYRCRGMMLTALREGNVHNQEELEKAVASGAEIVIANDFSVGRTVLVSSGKSVAIDLNGCTLCYEGASGTPMFDVRTGGILTVSDAVSSQYKVSAVKEGMVQTPGKTEYDKDTKKLTYYVTESELNLDGRSTTDSVWEYTLDLDSSGIGTLDGKGIGAVFSVTGGRLNIKSGRIRNKKESAADGWNGITMSSGTIEMGGGYIVDCGTDSENGGAIYAEGGYISISGGVIADNVGKNGGAVWIKNSGSTLAISNSIIAHNHSIQNGGAIYNTNAKILIEGMTAIVGNSAGKHGGGVLSFGSTSLVNFTGGQVAGNSAADFGGGFYFENSGTDNLIGNHTSSKEGDTNGNKNQIEANVILANSSAGKYGGGIYAVNSKIKIDSNNAKTVILGNTAGEEGGGIYKTGSQTVTIQGKSIIAANKAEKTASNSTYPAPLDAGSFTVGTDCYIEGMWKTDSKGAVTSVKELREAVTAASSSRYDTTVIPLGSDLNMAGEKTLEVDGGKNIVLDLKGYKIEGNPAAGSSSIFSVAGKDSSLTIQDSEAGEDPAPRKVGESAGIPENAGKAGAYEDGCLTYYITESASNGIRTTERTYQYQLNPEARPGNKKIGAIKASGVESAIAASGNARIVLEGGIITNPGGKHGISVEDNSSFMMKGGYVVGSGSDSGQGSEKTDGGGIIVIGSNAQITGGVIAGNKASGDGGGIKAENYRAEKSSSDTAVEKSSNIQITGGIIAANIAQDRGGGISIEGNAQVGGDAVIASNQAHAQTPREGAEDEEGDVEDADKWKNAVNFHGGGGIFFDGDKEKGETLEIRDSCYITNNYTGQANRRTGTGGTGGGGIFARGLLRMNGGYVTGNKTKAAGGGIYLHSYYAKAGTAGQFPTRVGQYIMTGGTIAGNYAETEEGGGLRIDGKEGSIKGRGIYITNNKTGTAQTWGGGGVFVMSSAGLNIRNALITENTAEGFGGGVAGCNHGTNRVFAIQGGAIFNNTAHGGGGKLDGYKDQDLPKKDHRNHADRIDAKTSVIEEDKITNFIDYAYDGSEKSYQDFYCSNISQVYDRMLGGGSANWRGSYSNSSKTDGKLPEAYPLRIETDSYASASNMIGLNANPSPQTVAAAKSAAGIFITGNHSAAHGGGVMSNGTFGIGDNPGGEGGLIIRKEVQLADGTNILDKKEIFTFVVSWKDENGKEDNSGQGYQAAIEPAVSDGQSQILVHSGDTVALHNGQSIKITGLPIGEYEVKETNGDAYVRLPNDGLANGPLWQHFESEVTFRNIPKGKLTVKKVIYDGGSPIPAGDPRESDEFHFVIKFTDKEGNLLAGEYPDAYPYTKNSQEYTVPPKEGENYPTIGNNGEFTLKHNESITVHDLPAGAYYEVAEKKADGYISVPVQKGMVENSATAAYLEIRNESGDRPEDPTDPAGPTPTHPGGGDSGGGGGGGGSDPKDPTPPEPTETSPEAPAEEAEKPQLPSYPEELPDPNDPGSPESVTILENGVPRTYLKMWDPEKQEFMYIPEDEIPLAFMLPPTGDHFRRILWAVLCGISLSGMAALALARRRKRNQG
ncbi:hypothetical protein D3Z51_11550 [Clostridiaceae bacterium]|nr:hypothetical protein [Clostridiaceae bacterium]RKI12848.1 hypothetical protein D7V81_11490 [bacterium 1XD21-70]